MTVLEIFQSKRIDELVEWFDESIVCDGSPWIEWFDTKYCKDCEPEIGYISYLNKEAECNWCELHGKCKYFKDLNSVPDNKQTIKLWLESES